MLRRSRRVVSLPSRIRRNEPVEVRIGVTYTPKEIEVDVSEDTDRDQLIGAIEEAVSTVQREAGPDPYKENWCALASKHLSEGVLMNSDS